MTASMLVSTLTSRGARLSVRDGRLRVEAPVGTLTPADRAALAKSKAEVLALLMRPAGSPGTDAETPAPWRRPAELADWTIEWRERFGILSNQFHDAGASIWDREDERQAFAEIKAEMEGSP